MPINESQRERISIVLLGGDAALEAMLREATALAFSSATLSVISDLSVAAPESEAEGVTLLAMGDPTVETVTQALSAKDTLQLPRWTVVIFGENPFQTGPAPAEVVPRTEWDPVQVARVLRLLSAQHSLNRENTRLRGDFLTFGYRISHDLRTPLGGILTTAEMLREILAEDAPSVVPLTQPLLDSADGLVKLIERVGAFARAIAGREAPQSLAMETVFWNAFQKLESRLMKSSANFRYPSTWPRVWGHVTGLESVWYNLILNALTHGGAPLTIDAGWEAVAGGHRFWIANSGPIPTGKNAGLFFPFHRLHEAGAPRGLGLPMVRRLVELDGGYCGYGENPEGHSCFYFFLPDLAVREV